MSSKRVVSVELGEGELSGRGGRGLWLRGLIWTFLVLGVGVVGMKALAGLRKPARRRVVELQRVQVEAQEVRKRRLAFRLEGVGTTQALRQVRLMPELSGTVSYVSPQLREGARVKKGTLLLRIDGSSHSIEYKRLQGQYRSLQKQIKLLAGALSLDRRNVSRNRRLLKANAIDRSSFERQEMQALDRQQRWESMRQSASNIKGQLKSIAWKLGRMRMRAPFDARVTESHVEKGGYVSPGQSIATLESQYVLEIPVSFSADALRQIRDAKGNRVDWEHLVSHLQTMPPVKITQSGHPEQQWRGRVVRLGAKLDLSTRTVPLWIRIDLREVVKQGRRKIVKLQPTLLPGTFCHVEIPIRAAQDAIVVPKQALYRGGFAYLAIDGKLSRRKVEVAHIQGDSAILSSGLQPGEQLIVSPLIDPIEGAQILVQARTKRQ